ncbi:hypothetical protein LG634_24890 [Streptomyces bambusae]|uniref:hypothetical protein n=1 Tax=Streptomyces bambusae TaxID=1550616 RepID=UPI001CFC6B4A|nr:hypothetical protein [Streptomyces bambusae]MCB5168051.1 hypothetical protein [Streptomyces bambusae]
MTRREWLLAEIRREGKPVTTHRAELLLATSPWPTSGRNTARKDLRALGRRGELLPADVDGRPGYVPTPTDIERSAA